MNDPILPKNVNFLISRLNSCGYDAFIVGGCVRDYILGKTPSDYDITTSATPEEMKTVLFDLPCIETGIKHGTLTFLVEGVPFEITTFRCDGEYPDHRHPETVEFTRDIINDLARRDFTMNAIAYNPNCGFVDMFFGRNDISAKIIRAVGDARVRFFEDALRILRAIRFSSVLNFEIERETAAAARKMRGLLSSVSSERIAVEWKKLLEGGGAYSVIEKYTDIIEEFVEIKDLKLPDAYRFCESRPEIRELSLFALSSSDPVRDFALSADKLKYDNKRKKQGEIVLSYFNCVNKESTEKDIKHLLSEIGAEYTSAVIDLRYLLGEGTAGVRAMLDKIIKENQPYRISDLKISGRDVLSQGVSGPIVGEILRRILRLVIDEELENTRESLLIAVKNISSCLLADKN